MKKLIILNLDTFVGYKTINYELLAYVENIALNSQKTIYKIPVPETHYTFVLCSILYEPYEHIEYKYTYRIHRETDINE
jgi:hypothetical protein